MSSEICMSDRLGLARARRIGPLWPSQRRPLYRNAERRANPEVKGRCSRMNSGRRSSPPRRSIRSAAASSSIPPCSTTGACSGCRSARSPTASTRSPRSFSTRRASRSWKRSRTISRSSWRPSRSTSSSACRRWASRSRARVAAQLGHARYVPLGTSRKFWYREELSVPLSSITTPEQPKRLYVDPRMLPLLEGRRVALIDDVVSSGASMDAASAIDDAVQNGAGRDSRRHAAIRSLAGAASRARSEMAVANRRHAANANSRARGGRKMARLRRRRIMIDLFAGQRRRAKGLKSETRNA